MQKKGISRRIDELGRIVIPKEIRRNLKIRESDELDITIDGENIILNKHEVIGNDKVVDEYIKLIIDDDLTRLDGINRDKHKVKLLLKSLLLFSS